MKFNKRLLWWNLRQERWQEADFETFNRWRGLELLTGDAEGDGAWPEIGAGDHRFVVCVMDEDDKTVINFIAHRYNAGLNGMFEGCPSNLTVDEKKEWDRLYAQVVDTIEDEERLRELQNKEFTSLQLPLKLVQSLVSDMPWSITTQTDHGFWPMYKHHGGDLPAWIRMN